MRLREITDSYKGEQVFVSQHRLYPEGARHIKDGIQTIPQFTGVSAKIPMKKPGS